MYDEHRDFGAIFGRVEHLFCYVVGRVEVLESSFTEKRQCSFLLALKLVVINSGWAKERSEGKEELGVLLSGGDRGYTSQIRHIELANERTIEVIEFEDVLRV